MSSITIKTQYGGDIRRFNVDATNGSLFASIQSTISSLYKLTGRSFTINYIDEEGDACVCSGDEETREALRFAGDHGRVLKLNVVIIDGPAVVPVASPLPVEPATPKAAAPASASASASPALETKKPVVRPHVSFVGDVTIEDGSVQVGGSNITKTWTIKNTNGNWPMTVAIVAVNDKKAAPVSEAVAHITAGTTDTGNVSVPIKVPTVAGRHKFEYHIVTADGAPVDGDYQLWADIVVRAAVSAAFVADVTIEDGSDIAANSTVKKVWSIKNDGVEQWPQGSLLVHNDGAVVPSPLFEADVKGVAVPSAQPNETVQVAVHVVAPSTSGRHHGEFHLCRADGSKFANDYALWTQINVPVPTLTPHEVISSLPKWMEEATVRAAVDRLRSSPATANASTSTSSSSSGAVHVGISCDGCGQSPIVGLRFKCGTCADFDYCQSCEAKNGHAADHSFIKMKVPVVPRHMMRRAESKATSCTNWRAAPATPATAAAAAPVVLPPVAVVTTNGLSIKMSAAAVPRANKKPSVPRCQFKSDITLPDGSHVSCGSVAVKRWAITNIGDEVWPEGTQLMFVGGALQPAAPSANEPVSLSPVSLAAPNQTVEVYARVQIPVIPGRHTGYFRLATSDGKRFGHRLWLDIVAIAPVTSQPVGTTPTPVVAASKLEVKAPVAAAVAVPMPVPVVVAATPSASAPVPSAPAAPHTKYVAELAQLKELGYSDEDMLADLLQAAGGRVSQVVEWLVTPVV